MKTPNNIKAIAKAIKEIDSFYIAGNTENVKRLHEARKNLINILFSSGYELQDATTYTPVLSKTPRKLIS